MAAARDYDTDPGGPIESPYTPGVVAVFTPGRERQLARMERALVRVAGQGRFEGRIHVVQGARGVGKTSLLRVIERKANALGITSVFVTAGTGSVLAALATELQERVRATAPESLAARVRAAVSALTVELGGVGVGVSLRDRPVHAMTGTSPDAVSASAAVPGLKRLIELVARSGENASRGLLLLVDEVQDMPSAEIRVLATAWQELQSEVAAPGAARLPAAVFAAGLGDVHDAITRGASFGERFHFETLRNLSDEAAVQAVIEPASAAGVSWSFDALESMLALSGGYPYFVQLYADEAWHARARYAGDVLTPDDVAAGCEMADDQVRAFYRGRWLRATEAERRVLIALARTGGDEATRSQIAEAMGVKSNDISMARASLVAKGLLVVARRGVLAFAAPGFGRYIVEEHLA